MFRVKVREVAESKGFRSAGALARQSRVSYATVHRLWNEPDKSEENLTLGVLFRLAQTLGVSISELVESESGNWVPTLMAA
jgi:transcriptional regulator with XRE-family HTH domain